MVWYCNLSQNFPQFIVIHTVKGFGIVKEAEIDVFLELSCFSRGSVTQSCLTWQPHARTAALQFPCASLFPEVCSNLRALSW